MSKSSNPEDVPHEFPSFIIVGAAKSGTTWLVKCLQEHPSVFIPANELHVLEDERPVEEYRRTYRSEYDDVDPDQLTGETSNRYLTTPGIARKIHQISPSTRIIAMLRDPVDRTYSSYCMSLRRNRASMDIESYLDPDQADPGTEVTTGWYFTHLSRYYDQFPREQIKPVLFDTMVNDPVRLWRDVCSFLDISTDVKPDLLHKKVNTKSHYTERRGMNLVVRVLRKLGVQVDDPEEMRFSWLRNLLFYKQRYPKMPGGLEEHLYDYFVDEIERLEDLTDLDLSNWKRV